MSTTTSPPTTTTTSSTLQNSSSITSTTTSPPTTTTTSSSLQNSLSITSTTTSPPTTTTTSSTLQNSPSTTTPPPATSTPLRPTTTPGVCRNGGTWLDGHCKCPPGFTGDACDDISNTIATNAVTNGTVQVELRVTNREFTDDLWNPGSSTYLEFVETFKKQMDVVYSNIQGYGGIKVLRLTPGSVVVDHIIIVSLLVTAQAQEKLHNITAELQEEIRAAAAQLNCTSGTRELCFNSSDVVVRNASLNFDKEAFCQQEVPEGYQDYYFPNLTSSGFYCISNCTPGTPGSISCNKGQCRLTLSGPQCFCHETDLYWYRGDRCETRVGKLAVGLGVAAAALAATVVVLAVLLFRAQRTRSFYSTQKAMKQTWYEDAVDTWSLPGSFTFQNQGAHTEDNFRVNLESLHTSAPVNVPRPEKFYTRL
ncbi:mucin-3A-like [Phalacrocorax aristotelis]|uniref:mucin-3A-like n=1 Tax=Phalacrocorax aristotelis TaxID=126867 RepID=UPI003F4B6690